MELAGYKERSDNQQTSATIELYQRTQDFYDIEFTVKYETEFGQEMVILGSIDQLGNWNDLSKGKMKWSDGHVWRLKIKAYQPVFTYKYVVLNSDGSKRWEQGFNRLADLELLRQENQGSYNLTMPDKWQRYAVHFSIYYPLKEGQVMRLMGEGKELGQWARDLNGPFEMCSSKEEVTWLTGTKVKPWVWSTEFNQTQCPKLICYKYSIRDTQTGDIVWEREPSRYVDIQDPDKVAYHGELGQTGSAMQRNVNKVFVVNGKIDKADANFVGNMTFDKIGDTKIFLGQYPQTEEDTDLLL